MTVDDSNIVEKLVKLGLNLREAKLYYALLRVTESTPTELNRISDVQRTKIYEVLEQMKNKGLCTERQEGHKKFYRATQPSEVYSILRSRWDAEQNKREAERKKQEAEHEHRRGAAEEIFGKLESLHKVSVDAEPALERLEVIRSKEQMHLKILKLLNGCQEEILSFTRKPYAASDEAARDEQTKANQNALDRGVKARTLYMMDEASKLEWLADGVQELEQAGEEARLIDALPMKMFVFDKSTVLFWLQFIPDLSGDDFTMIVVEDQGFAEACCRLFDSYWEQGSVFAK